MARTKGFAKTPGLGGRTHALTDHQFHLDLAFEANPRVAGLADHSHDAPLIVEGISDRGGKFRLFLIEQLDWNGNVDPNFKDNHYLEPIIAAGGADAGYVDKWIVYGKMGGEELFTAKELTIKAGTKVTIRDSGAYGLIAVQGSGWVGKHRLHTPAMIRFGELTEDEVFVGYEAARNGVIFDNTGTEPLVTLRYFGPDTNPQAPAVGDYKKGR